MKGRPLTDEELSIQTCNSHHNPSNNTELTCLVKVNTTNTTGSFLMEDENTQKPKDYTTFLAALTAFIAFFNLMMIIFFNAPFKRAMANKEEPKDA